MKAVIQRVNFASCKVNGKLISKINEGYLIYLGFKNSDKIDLIDKAINKIIKLRIFEDENGKTNLDIKSNNSNEILLISQFTLYANLKEGNRPSFTEAMNFEKAKEFYDIFLNKLNSHIKTYGGIFGANMKIESSNNGPFTAILEME